MNQDYKNFIFEKISEFYCDNKISIIETSLSRQATLKVNKSIDLKLRQEMELVKNFDDLKLKLESKKETLKQHIEYVFKNLIEDCQSIENRCLTNLSNSEIKTDSNLPFDIESNFNLIKMELLESIKFCNKNSLNLLKPPNLDLVQQKYDIKAHRFNVQSLKLFNQSIVSSGADFQIKIWDTKSHIFLKRNIQIDSHAKLFDLFESELTIGCKNGNLVIYDLNKDLYSKKICVSQWPVTSILNIDKEILVIGDQNGVIKFYYKINFSSIRSINGHKKSVLCLRKFNNEEILSGSLDNTIKLWNIKYGECLRSFNLHAYAVYCIEILDESRFVSCSWDKSIKIWDKETGKCIKSLEGHRGPIRWIELFENEEIMSCSDDGTIKHWIDGKCFKTLNANSGPLNCFKILKNGQILIACLNGSIKIWK